MRALAVVKDFHSRLQGLEERLQDSERQRAVLERRLVQQSGGEEGAQGGAGAGGGVGFAAKLAAVATGDGNDAVVEAQKR